MAARFRASYGGAAPGRAVLLPAAAERAIDLDERRELAQLRLHEPELGDEQPRVAVEHLEIAGGAALVAEVGEPPRILRGGRQQLLLRRGTPAPVGSRRARPRPRGTPAGSSAGRRAPPPRRVPSASATCDRVRPAVKIGCTTRWPPTRPRAGGEQRRQRRAGDAAGAGQRDLREVRAPWRRRSARWPRPAAARPAGCRAAARAAPTAARPAPSGGMRLLGRARGRGRSAPGCRRAARS